MKGSNVKDTHTSGSGGLSQNSAHIQFSNSKYLWIDHQDASNINMNGQVFSTLPLLFRYYAVSNYSNLEKGLYRFKGRYGHIQINNRQHTAIKLAHKTTNSFVPLKEVTMPRHFYGIGEFNLGIGIIQWSFYALKNGVSHSKDSNFRLQVLQKTRLYQY